MTSPLISGSVVEHKTATELRSELKAAFDEERRLLDQLERYVALLGNPAQGRRMAEDIFVPKLREVRARREALYGRIKEAEEREIRELSAQIASAHVREEEDELGTPRVEPPAFSD